MSILSRLRRRPKLSLVMVIYDMAREAPRTLRSLALPYQREIAEGEYEVIVVDNGSPQPLGEAGVREFGPQFRYHYIQDAPKSPALAVNRGVNLSEGDIVGIYIDGARIATPGLLAMALRAFRLHDDPVVATLGWHLGPEVQQKSVLAGYNREVEDRLLQDIAWPSDGYRLFEIATIGLSSRRGYFLAPSESNALFLRRRTFDEMGGMDLAFDEPGGGLVNLDFFIRALERPGSPLVMLLGEGTFHQLHGGASTGAMPSGEDRFQRWAAHYREIRGKPWQHPSKEAIYLGTIPREMRGFLSLSIEQLLSNTGRD